MEHNLRIHGTELEDNWNTTGGYMGQNTQPCLFWRRMLLLLLRLLLQLLLGVEAPTRQLPLTMPQGLSEAFLMLRSACPSACASVDAEVLVPFAEILLHVAHYLRACFGYCSHLWKGYLD